MNIIIPSAKIVPEGLQNLGKLPAIIYPVNQRIVFDYLHEQYKNEKYKIVCYENANKVRKRLAQYTDIEIIELDNLKDLGYSIYLGIKNCKGEGFVNFADTIVMDDILSDNNDMFFYAEDTMSSTWTFFEEQNGVIETIIDKKPQTENKIGKLFVGVFKFSHLEYLSECLNKAFTESPSTMNTFYYALILYSRTYAITPVKAKNWFDIGHVDNYYNSQLEVKARTFNHIKIDKFRGILTKSSDDVDKFIGEIKWYLKLPDDIEYVRPRIFNYSLDYTSPYVSMEYYAYHTLHELFLYGDLTKEQWRDIFQKIKFVCSDFKRYFLKDTKIKESLEDIYLKKTFQRIKQLEKQKEFQVFFSNNITVNGIKYFCLNNILKLLKDIIPKLLYDIDQFCIIHGDLCFSNIMVDTNFSFIKVIDPRGKFGKFDIYGDQRYEIAKLIHSIDGKYDFIIKDLFSLKYNLLSASIEYQISDRDRNYNLYTIFKEVFKNEIGDNLRKIELIEALLFLSMIPLHTESIKHQIAMLSTGLDILNRVESIII